MMMKKGLAVLLSVLLLCSAGFTVSADSEGVKTESFTLGRNWNSAHPVTVNESGVFGKAPEDTSQRVDFGASQQVQKFTLSSAWNVGYGDKIKLSVSMAREKVYQWDYVHMVFGLSGTAGAIALNTDEGIQMQLDKGTVFAAGTFGAADAQAAVIPKPINTWCTYELVYTVGKDAEGDGMAIPNTLSVYSDGVLIAGNIVLKKSGTAVPAITTVSGMQLFERKRQVPINFDDIALTYYPAAYDEAADGAIVESNPVSEAVINQYFVQSSDGALAAKRADLTAADISNAANADGWAFSFVDETGAVQDKFSKPGYLKMTKGKAVYYRKAEPAQARTYAYEITSVNGTHTLTKETGAFGKTAEQESQKLIQTTAGNHIATMKGDTAAKQVAPGQKIKVSVQAAADPWHNAEVVNFAIGLEMPKTDTTHAKNNVAFIGIAPKSGKPLKVGAYGNYELSEDTVITPNICPSYQWVTYDMVITVGEEGLNNTWSLYADGQPYFEDQPMVLGEVSAPITQVMNAALMPVGRGEDKILHFADISMTIYPEGFDGVVVEQNPLTKAAAGADFVWEKDGTLTYVGEDAVGSAVQAIAAPEGWTYSYINENGYQYLKMEKGGTVYYKKIGVFTVRGFALNGIDTTAGEKTLSVQITNQTAGERQAALILASYDSEGILVGLGTSGTQTLAAASEPTEVTAALTVGAGGVSEIRAFLWVSLSDLIPIQNSITTKTN